MYIKKKCRESGFTLVEIMIAVAIIALLTSLAIPSMQKSRRTTRDKLCQNNLKLIQSALEEYLLIENVDVDTDATTIYNGILVGAFDAFIEDEPLCPIRETSYTITTFGDSPTCTVRDADPSNIESVNHQL